jgi:iron complex transport system ATP-binding protein
VVAVTHDLNLAASYADRIVVLSAGKIVADGKPASVLNADLLRSVFEVDLEIREGPGGKPWVLYEQRRASVAENPTPPLC